MADIKVVVMGAAGRMGRANINAVTSAPGLKLVAALEREGSPALGTDAGVLAGLEPVGIPVTSNIDEALDKADAVIDFTTPEASVALVVRTAQRGLVHVIGTTGCSEQDEQAFRDSASSGARIVKSGNMSLGVNLLAALVEKAAQALGTNFDIEVLEMHHNRKVDAPSGTALLLGEAAARGRNIALKDHSVRVRDGHTGPREEGTIGFATLRGGTVVGDHSVMFAGPSERITLSHHAEDRAIFAHGAVKAAQWAFTKKPGFYSMADVLGL